MKMHLPSLFRALVVLAPLLLALPNSGCNSTPSQNEESGLPQPNALPRPPQDAAQSNGSTKAKRLPDDLRPPKEPAQGAQDGDPTQGDPTQGDPTQQTP